jgi:hypothetical protein
VLSGGRLGAMLTSLGNDLTVRQRKKLSELDMPIGNMSGGLTGGSSSHSSGMGKLHDLLNIKCQEYYSLIDSTISNSNDALREVLGPQSISREYSQKYFSPVKTSRTMKNYSSRIARFIRLFYTLSQNSFGTEMMGESMVTAFNVFAEGLECEHGTAFNSLDIEDLHVVLVAVARYNGGLGSSYKDCLPCLYGSIVLSDSTTGAFVNVETTAKALSALKFFIRGALLIEASREIKQKTERGGVILQVGQLKSLHGVLEVVGEGSTNTLSTLARMAKVIFAFELPAHVRLIFPDPTDSRFCLVNGKEFGHLALKKMVDVALSNAKRILKSLMLGYTFHNSDGNQEDATTVRLPGFAFGRPPRDRNMEDPCLKKRTRQHLQDRFWLPDPESDKLILNGDVARAYLRQCMELEKHLVVIFHVLGGCGSRGPDFQLQTFRNGKDTKRNVFILGSTVGDQVLAFCVPNSKSSQQHNKAKSTLSFINFSQVEFILPYYLVVRPWACELRRCVGHFCKDLTSTQVARLHPVVRWDRFLYVSADAESKRNHIARAAAKAVTGSKDITFNEIRHVAIALNRKFIVPQEHAIQDGYPVHQGFGHTQQADNRYGLETLTQEYGSCDASSVLRCSRSWWKLLEN